MLNEWMNEWGCIGRDHRVEDRLEIEWKPSQQLRIPLRIHNNSGGELFSNNLIHFIFGLEQGTSVMRFVLLNKPSWGRQRGEGWSGPPPWGWDAKVASGQWNSKPGSPGWGGQWGKLSKCVLSSITRPVCPSMSCETQVTSCSGD